MELVTLEVKNLVVDGHAFGNRVLDIESNLFAKLVIDYARKNTIDKIFCAGIKCGVDVLSAIVKHLIVKYNKTGEH